MKVRGLFSGCVFWWCALLQTCEIKMGFDSSSKFQGKPHILLVLCIVCGLSEKSWILHLSCVWCDSKSNPVFKCLIEMCFSDLSPNLEDPHLDFTAALSIFPCNEQVPNSLLYRNLWIFMKIYQWFFIRKIGKLRVSRLFNEVTDSHYVYFSMLRIRFSLFFFHCLFSWVFCITWL